MCANRFSSKVFISPAEGNIIAAESQTLRAVLRLLGTPQNTWGIRISYCPQAGPAQRSGGSMSTSLVITLGTLSLGGQAVLTAPQVPQSSHFLSHRTAQKVLWRREILVIFQIFTAVFISTAWTTCHSLILLESL